MLHKERNEQNNSKTLNIIPTRNTNQDNDTLGGTAKLTLACPQVFN